MHHTSPPSIQSTLSGSSVPRIPTMNLDLTQVTTPNAAWAGMSLPLRSVGSLSYTSGGSNTDTVPGQRSYPDRSPSENGDDEDGENELAVGDVDVRSVEGYVYPPSILASGSTNTCRRNWCPYPTFFDSTTDLESEYYSRRQRVSPFRHLLYP